jgi:hypothetical protein
MLHASKQSAAFLCAPKLPLFAGFLRRLLGQRMLVSCEVAVEYYLSMVHSPQIQWLQQADEAWPLQQEVEAEVDAAYK